MQVPPFRLEPSVGLRWPRLRQLALHAQEYQMVVHHLVLDIGALNSVRVLRWIAVGSHRQCGPFVRVLGLPRYDEGLKHLRC